MASNFVHTETIEALASGGSPELGSSRDIAGTFGLVATLDVVTISGATGTFDVKLQHSPDGNTWYDIPSGAFAQVTSVTGDETLTFPDGTLYRFVRTHSTVAGGDRAFTANVHMEGRS